MSLINLSLLVIIIFLILLSGFLSGSETAITATSKARIISKLKKGTKRAEYVKKIIDSKDKVISSLLLSNNLVNILASSLATAFFYDLFGVTGIFYATLLMTFLLVIFAEVLPKTYAINKPTRSALMIGPIIFYLNKILTPFVFVINSIVKVLINKKEINDKKLSDEQSEEELQGVIDLYKTSNPDSEHEKEMLQSILTLNDTTVEEIFTHRRSIYSINIDLSLSEIIKMINQSRFTRIPCWKNNPENIIGLLNIRSLNIDMKDQLNNKKIILEKIVKPWFIPSSTNLLDQLVEFKKKREHLAFVVDEYGELLGIISLEDIIEEIVGEIVDEIDAPEKKLILNNKGVIVAEGNQNIKDLYKEFDLDVPEIESSTIAGHVMDLAKKIPMYGETIKDKKFNYKITSHSRKQILRLEITKI
ncbi:CNNM domain-containing protein [Alphaproteobacteria bacterium]|nr:CNNM domain-containing protein [Alphaproteobacteria bacterium]